MSVTLEDIIENPDILEEEPERKPISNRRRIVIIAAIIVLILVGGYVIFLYQEYRDYTVERKTDSPMTGESKYEDFSGNMLRYNNDGALFTDYDDNILWNETYEMASPCVDRAVSYFILYDRGGSQILLMNDTGLVRRLGTTLPVTKACVSDNGVVAVLMQTTGVSYIHLYNSKGDTIASGEIHTAKGGYPVTLAISADGKELCVSMLNLNDGAVNTNINFYNYGLEGQGAIDNLVGTFSYTNMIIPEVAYVSGDRILAFGDSEVVVFKGGTEIAVEAEIFAQSEIKSIFYNKDYFATINGETDENGEPVNRMHVYKLNGSEKLVRDLEFPYTKAEFLSNDEILITDGNKAVIYTTYGVKKFEYEFENNLYEVMSGRGFKDYTFIMSDSVERVRLK
ncbi:MAG: DUF5711 family protein [Lachnospiraceae bacterium]|nr:DUF5711 family protein [Lachnospiraceae bacterium]